MKSSKCSKPKAKSIKTGTDDQIPALIGSEISSKEFRQNIFNASVSGRADQQLKG